MASDQQVKQHWWLAVTHIWHDVLLVLWHEHRYQYVETVAHPLMDRSYQHPSATDTATSNLFIYITSLTTFWSLLLLDHSHFMFSRRDPLEHHISQKRQNVHSHNLQYHVHDKFLSCLVCGQSQWICGDSNFCSAQKHGALPQIRRRNFSFLRRLCELLSQEISSKSH